VDAPAAADAPVGMPVKMKLKAIELGHQPRMIVVPT
jgi:hypothetical protein